MDETYMDFVPKVHFELIPIKSLVSNQKYQRNLSAARVERTAENFDPYQINPVKVSRRDGINYVFNGQHTIEIIATVSGSRETPVWCMIYDDLDYEQEADIFANQLRFTKPLAPFEIFNANIEAGNDIQITIKSLVESYRLTIGTRKNPGVICAVSALEFIFGQYGYHVLDRTLMLCVAAWEGDPNSLSSNMLKGIAKLVSTYGEALRDDLFVEKMGRVPVRDIIRTAKERNVGSLGYAEAIFACYNKKLRFPLPRNKLYGEAPPRETGFVVSGTEEDEDMETALSMQEATSVPEPDI